MLKVGYLLNTSEGLTGESGFYYNYILAGNGVFVHGQGPLLTATVCVDEVDIRGLAPLRSSVVLTHGKLPLYIQDLALSILAVDPWHERYLAVVWDRDYELKVPEQDGRGAGVDYQRLPHTVMDIHSHCVMSAWFSGTDNRDEQGLGLYMVVGNVDLLIPEVRLRVGVYGYFAHLELEDVFGV